MQKKEQADIKRIKLGLGYWISLCSQTGQDKTRQNNKNKACTCAYLNKENWNNNRFEG